MTDPDGGRCLVSTRGRVSDADRAEIRAFKRFLAEAGDSPQSVMGVFRKHPGWGPYTLGRFFFLDTRGGALLAPPEGYGDVPVTAWTFPG